MKKLTLSVLAATGIALFASHNAQAQNSASAPSNAAATVVVPIAISNTAGLNFGTVTTPVGAVTVLLTSAGVRSSSPENILGIPAGVSAAGFGVSGEAGATYAITLPTVETTISSGANTMSVDTFTGSKATGTLTAGVDSFTVGATLHMGAAQIPGSYSGTFSVTAAYN